MLYTKKAFGSRLKQQIAQTHDIVKIARWTYREFLEHAAHLEDGLEHEMMRLIAMEEGPEFELTENEIRALADALSTAE